jgi:protein-disulfide isomerase
VQSPVIERLKQEFPHVYPVNVAEDSSAARALGILGTPATVIIEGGVVRSVLLGFKREDELRKALA